MKIKTAGFLGFGILIFLVFAGCGESPVEDGANGGDAVSKFTVFRTEHGLADNSVTGIAVDYMFNGVWFATRSGISFYSKADSTFFTYGVEYLGIPDMKVTSINVDYSGTVWAGTETGAGYLPQDDSLWIALPQLDSRHVTDVIMKMSDFSVWFGTRSGLIVKSSQDVWTTHFQFGLSNDVTSLEIDSAGNMWVGTTNGISVFDAFNNILTSYGSPELPNTYVNVIYKDIGGNIWCGTASIAVAYDGNSWVKYGSADGLTSCGINDFAEDNFGILWAATDGGVFFFMGNKWNSFDLPDEIASESIKVIEVDRKTGDLWIGTTNGAVRYIASTEGL